MATATYYFDGSDASATDPGGVWTNDANAFDGSTATAATSVTNGSAASNFLLAEGTDAPTSGGAITQVRARIYAEDSLVQGGYSIYTDGLAETLLSNLFAVTSPPNWSSYSTLTTPSGGWTWAKVAALETKVYKDSGPGTLSVYRVEVEVTYTSLPLTSTIQDNFDSSAQSSVWASSFGTVTQTGGRLKCDSSLAGQYSGLSSISTDLTSSYAIMEVTDAGNQALTSWEVYACQVYLDASNGVHWLIAGNTVYARKVVAGATSVVGSSFAYNSTNHRWFKISESSGTITYSYSANGFEWTDHTTLAVPFAITSMTLEPTGGNYAAEASTTSAYFDNVNIFPNRMAWFRA